MRGLTFEKPKKRYSLSKCYANFLTILRIYRTTMILVIGETFGYFNNILTIQHIGAVLLPSAANNFSWLVTLTN